MNDCSRVRIYRVHCCCCCSPAAPGCPARCQLTRLLLLLLRLRLLCRLWAIALWTSQCWPPAAWDLWCLPRWRCMFAPKAPTGCFCYPAKRERERSGSRIINQVVTYAKDCPEFPLWVPFYFFSFISFFSSLFYYFLIFNISCLARRHQIRTRATVAAAVCHFRARVVVVVVVHFVP